MCNDGDEQAYKVMFKVKKGKKHPSVITYIQRSLSNYYLQLNQAGFQILEFHEMNRNDKCEPGVLTFVCKKVN